MLAQIIGGFVVIFLGVALLPVIRHETASIINSTAIANVTSANITSWGETVLNLIPTFFTIGLILAGLAVAYNTLRATGILGEFGGGMDEDDECDDYEERKKMIYSKYFKPKKEIKPLKLRKVTRITEEEITRSKFD